MRLLLLLVAVADIAAQARTNEATNDRAGRYGTARDSNCRRADTGADKTTTQHPFSRRMKAGATG
jgi:hypothetical protein